MRQAHCSSLKEWFSGFLSRHLLTLVLSTHHVWAVHDFELRDVAGISRTHSTSRTRANYPGPQIWTKAFGLAMGVTAMTRWGVCLFFEFF